MSSIPISDRSCPVCGERKTSSLWQKEDLSLVRCQNCAMIFTRTAPPEMAGQFYNDLGTPYYLSPEKLESDYASVRFERELRLFRKFCPGGKVLDVGCSTGAFLYQLNQRNPGQYQVLGTDVSAPALAYAQSRGVNIVTGSFPDHDFGGAQFDAITFWAVLEHLPEPKPFVEKAVRLLKPGGYCFILVPNMKSLAVRLLGMKYRYIYPQHLNYFTPDTLQRLVTETQSMKLITRGTMHFNPVVIVQDFRRRGAAVSDAERAALLKRTTSWKQKPALKPVKFLYRAAEQMLAGLGLADNLFVVLQKQ